MSEDEFTGLDSTEYESMDAKPKKSYKIPALIVGIAMIVIGGIGIVTLLVSMFSH